MLGAALVTKRNSPTIPSKTLHRQSGYSKLYIQNALILTRLRRIAHNATLSKEGQELFSKVWCWVLHK